jgi:quercetin dioxygenase-like cupin family protein
VHAGASADVDVDRVAVGGGERPEWKTAPVRMMKLGAARSTSIDRFGSHGVDVGPIARTDASEVVSVVLATISPGGEIGRHTTRVWQVFYVTAGSGWVTGEEGDRVPISAGMAASFTPGEEHGSGSDEGLVACIVESSTDPVAAFTKSG